MNEYTAKKLGEVLAFAEVGIDTLQKGEVAIKESLGEEKFEEFVADNKDQIEAIKEIAEGNEVLEAVEKKAEATGEKLRKMREIYIKEDDWNDSAELMEWHGFFEGAALVHWSLIEGVGEKTENAKIISLVEDGKDLHSIFLGEVENALKEIGKNKS